ncbi:MAG TPA: A/G-specific adenine glycosylase, partial [Candidatus Acidoferrum sp.]|nr:A/G-specific adenine glycosylase [Candidatus Acidoferrum sp.]
EDECFSNRAFVREFPRAMLKARELANFRSQLLGWFRQFQRDLPWRRTSDSYRIWLSEIMLQQTRVAAAIPYYEKFLQRFPDVRSLAAAPQEEVLRLWSGLGYYSRARNLQKAAQQIVAQHGGEFPENIEEALALPGIGNYTAAAILSIAFEKKHAVLDGNVARVLARLGAIRGDLRAPRRWKELQETASAYLDPESPGDWNQAMMELGATLCTPKSPQCLLCPVNEFCEGRKLGIADSLPEKRKKRATVTVTLAAAVFADEKGRTLLLPPPLKTSDAIKVQAKEKTSPDHVPTLVSRMWHFPTLSVNGNPAARLNSHLHKLFSTMKNAEQQVTPAEKVRHTVTYRDVTVLPFRIEVKKLPSVSGAKQIPLADLSSLPVSNLTRKVARAALAAATPALRKREE